MRYQRIEKAEFLTRPNRFVAEVRKDGETLTVHVKNTGRCRELLVPGAAVYLERANRPGRRTAWDLVTVEKRCGERRFLINMDASAPNELAAEWLPRSGYFRPDAVYRREVTAGDSRFDFCVTEGSRVSFLEVKGVTLEKDGTVYFPDAPTERGVKHLKELARLVREGYGGHLLLVAQMGNARRFRPADRHDPAFAAALRDAAAAGVSLHCVRCAVSPRSVEITEEIPIQLEGESEET